MTNSAGTQQTATLYSATADVGSNYAMLYVDSTNCYVPLVSTSATTATSGRVIKNGTTYAIGSSASVAYDYREFKTATSGTFTVPSGVYKLRVTCVGGGSGGVCVTSSDLTVSKVSTYLKSYSGSNGVYTNARFKNVDGGTTTFGSVSASGGYKAYTTAKYTYTVGTGDEPETVTCFYPTKITTNVGYNQATMYSDGTWHAGASAVPLTGDLTSRTFKNLMVCVILFIIFRFKIIWFINCIYIKIKIFCFILNIVIQCTHICNRI